MAEERYELQLETSLASTEITVNNAQLKSDLQRLQRSVNKELPVLLSLGVNVPQSIGRMKSDILKDIKPQLDSLLKISVGVETSTLSKPTAGVGTKALTEESAAAEKVTQEYRQLLATLKGLNSLNVKIAKLDVEKDSAQLRELR